jgi:hypothetical protein
LRELLGTDSADTIAELVREIDKDGAGKIPFQTFFAAMTSGTFSQFLPPCLFTSNISSKCLLLVFQRI